MTNLTDVYWLSGLLEGEGHFRFNRRHLRASSAQIVLQMTDRDVVDRARNIIAEFNKVSSATRTNRKPIYSTSVAGARAVGWMMTLYQLLGTRRRQKIREVISQWRDEKPSKFHHTHSKLCRICGNEPTLIKVNAKAGRTYRYGKCRQCHRDRENALKRNRYRLRVPPELAAIGKERSRQATIARNIANTGRKMPRHHGIQAEGRQR